MSSRSSVSTISIYNRFSCVSHSISPFVHTFGRRACSNVNHNATRSLIDFRGQFGCKICGTNFNNANNMVSHILSPKHARKMVQHLDIEDEMIMYVISPYTIVQSKSVVRINGG